MHVICHLLSANHTCLLGHVLSIYFLGESGARCMPSKNSFYAHEEKSKPLELLTTIQSAIVEDPMKPFQAFRPAEREVER